MECFCNVADRKIPQNKSFKLNPASSDFKCVMQEGWCKTSLCVSDVKHVLSGLNSIFLSIYFPNHLSWAREYWRNILAEKASEERHSTSSYLLHYNRSKIHPKTKESEYGIVGSVMQLWSDPITNASFRKETQSPDREVRTANDSTQTSLLICTDTGQKRDTWQRERKKRTTPAGRKDHRNITSLHHSMQQQIKQDDQMAYISSYWCSVFTNKRPKIS